MKKHPTSVKGFDDNLTHLAENILRMRYDQVSVFFGECFAELCLQAAGDSHAGRPKLAKMLQEAASLANLQQQQFKAIFKLCKPHVKDELASES